MASKVDKFRTAFWHLRKGGIDQLNEWRQKSANQGPLGSKQDITKVQGISKSSSNTDPTVLSSKKRLTPPDLPQIIPLARQKSFPTITAGVILDDFSLAAWEPEFNIVPLTRSNWHAEIVDSRLDFLFVESAWAGNQGSWTHQITGRASQREELQELVTYCKDHGIPTVFWNKEDPVHFEDFIETAKLFDFVFTTDSELVPKYHEELGHKNVDVLSFAAQPSLHSPVRKLKSLNKLGIAFGGMYFAHKYPERREQMDILLNAAIAAKKRTGESFHIYSRHYGGDSKYQFPDPFDDYVVGSLPYQKMLAAYQSYKVFLNVNSVTESPTMCARRVFEILASGSSVVSGESLAIAHFFPNDEVPIVDSEAAAVKTLRVLLTSDQLRDRMIHKAQRRIWENHTYAHRAHLLLNTLGLTPSSSFLEKPLVSIICSTNRPDFVNNVLDSVARQNYSNFEFLLLTHGFQPDQAEVTAFATSKGIANFTLLNASSEDSLGMCLNKLVEASSGHIIAKFDDDDYYAENYLLDSVYALKYSNADLVGKRAIYLYSQEDDVVVLRMPMQEHKVTDFVAGATLVGYKRVFEENPFQNVRRGEDTRFLRSASQLGAKIYSADRFNFMQMRGAHAHTWNVENTALYAEGVVETFGLNLKHVTV